MCRTTLAVDGGVQSMADANMGVIISYTGAFLFPRMKNVERQIVIDSVNRVLLTLMFGGIQFDAIEPEDIGFGTIYGTGYFLATGGASGTNYCHLRNLQFQDVGGFEAINLLEPRTFTKSEILGAILKGGPVSEKLPEINPSMFLDGITHYKRFQLASALIFLWSTTESIVGKIWNERVVPTGKGITGRKKFVESGAWQASHKIEVIYQLGLIGKTLYAKLNKARSARNSLAHRGTTPTLACCESALEATFSLLSLVVTDYSRHNHFRTLVRELKQPHLPPSGPIEPQFWREIPTVPGDDKWGDDPFPRHPEIELVALKR
jgi:hypothetical protein